MICDFFRILVKENPKIIRGNWFSKDFLEILNILKTSKTIFVDRPSNDPLAVLKDCYKGLSAKNSSKAILYI